MATKTAIELIKIDIKLCHNQLKELEKFNNNCVKRINWKDASTDSTKYYTGKTVQTMYDIMSSAYRRQLESYEHILAQLQPEKRRNLHLT